MQTHLGLGDTTGTAEASLGVMLVNQRVELIVYHNAQRVTDARKHRRLIGEYKDYAAERDELVAFLLANLKGARNADEIVDGEALKMPDLPSAARQLLDEEVEREAALEALSHPWRNRPQRVWESVFLFGRRFEPLTYCSEPTIELSASEWFDSLHLLSDEGITLASGEPLVVRLNWSTYGFSGAIETSDFRRLKKEADKEAAAKMFDAGKWAQRQELALAALDGGGAEIPEVVERTYAVSPLSGQPIPCWGVVGPASYKSDSGDPKSWRSPSDVGTFITHWFKSRDAAEGCRAYSLAILESTRQARVRSVQKKQASDGHKTTAQALQSKLRLLVSGARLSDERRQAVEKAVLELDPLLTRTKSSNFIRWSADAEPLLNRSLREVMADDECARQFIDGMFEFVLENSSEGELQDEAVKAIDEIESLHKAGKLRGMENRAAKLDCVLVAVLAATNVAVNEGQSASRAA